jgi:hypothetical protein
MTEKLELWLHSRLWQAQTPSHGRYSFSYCSDCVASYPASAEYPEHRKVWWLTDVNKLQNWQIHHITELEQPRQFLAALCVEGTSVDFTIQTDDTNGHSTWSC